MKIQDYYTILDLPLNASKDQIKLAYRKLAKKYHPDVNPEADSTNFIKICEAYEFLIAYNPKPYQYANSKHHNSTSAYSKSGLSERQAYEQYRKEAAQKRARERFEKIQREKQRFKESGLFDLLLLIKYSLRIITPLVILGLIFLPVYVSITESSEAFFLSIFFWFIGGFLIFYIVKNRRTFFHPEKFYYSLSDIKNLLFNNNSFQSKECYYCKGEPANALPYEINLLLTKNTYLRNDGVFQHYVKYKNKNVSIHLPRSRKALFVHWISTIIKLVSIIVVMMWPINSVLWKLILGLLLGSSLSLLLHFFTHTRLRNSYIFTRGLIMKAILWLVIIILMSDFQFNPLNVDLSEMIGAVIASLMLFDPFVEDGIALVKSNSFSQPLISQPHDVTHYLEHNYRFYVSASVWSVIYPVFKWVFG